MHLVTFRTSRGHDHIGVVRDSSIVDLTVWIPSLKPGSPHVHFDMVDFIAAQDTTLAQARQALAAPDSALQEIGALVSLADAQLLAPINKPRKNVLCMGRNYQEHAAESMRAFKEGEPPADKPDFPIVFTKATTSVIGPYDDIPFDPKVSEQIDWEVELAVIIGKRGINIGREVSKEYVFGYTVLNDISARDIQKRHGNQYFKGKSLDGTCPTGPWIVTADEIGNPDDLAISLRVNGQVKQNERTSSMLFPIAEIIELMSLGMTLEPGDIIATGTPSGIGMARNPQEFLRPGDVVECEIEGIGAIKNRVVTR